ncbi:MAG: alpha amylase C-terminal domain-containing protein, partial [Eubacterium sp.]|nr:alpha amylase C-terminal domain-containing protein [Eubacterium sp.]
MFNSDAEQFGGSGVVNPRVKISRPVEHDERKDSIKVKVPPLGISVYQFSESVEKRLDNQSA